MIALRDSIRMLKLKHIPLSVVRYTSTLPQSIFNTACTCHGNEFGSQREYVRLAICCCELRFPRTHTTSETCLVRRMARILPEQENTYRIHSIQGASLSRTTLTAGEYLGRKRIEWELESMQLTATITSRCREALAFPPLAMTASTPPRPKPNVQKKTCDDKGAQPPHYFYNC